MNNYLPSQYQQFIHLSRYSRWLPDENRRETWDETVQRFFEFFDGHIADECNGYKIPTGTKKE